MENPETAAILGTRHRTKTNETKNTTQRKEEQHGHHQQSEVNSAAPEE